jgi:hypothetical protein
MLVCVKFVHNYAGTQGYVHIPAQWTKIYSLNVPVCIYIIAVWFTENNKPMYYLARVQRIKRRYKKAFVEYIRPVSLQDRLKDVYIQVNWYTLSLVNGHEYKYDSSTDATLYDLASVITGVTLQYDATVDAFRLEKSDKKSWKNLSTQLNLQRLYE